MDIISYNKEELNSNLAMTVSKLHKERYNSEFFINPALTRYSIIYILEFEFASKLHYVKIKFDTPKFEKITKDRAAKFVDQLSAIGGTMGLLTGFSIISGVEILYFAFKIAVDYYKKIRNAKFQ